MERKYFEINEQTAKMSHQMRSMRDYKQGVLRSEYMALVDEVYSIADTVAQSKPKRADDAYKLAERYSKNLANYYNKDSRIGCMCPSVMISGAGNFPVHKKEKQNVAFANNYKYFKYIEGIKERLISILYGNEIIKSSDEDAIEQLTEKLQDLEELQEFMKEVNAYYRKHRNFDNCLLLTEKQKIAVEDNIKNCWSKKPFAPYQLTNNNAKIKSTRDRIASLRKEKERGTQEHDFEYFQVVENTELMRLQLLFEEKPTDEERGILKRYGFRWAPSKNAWQRQLTNNARYALKNVVRAFEKIYPELEYLDK